MIALNLLPPEEKNNLSLEQARRWVLFYGGAVLLAAVLLIAMMLGIWFFIELQIKAYSVNIANTQTSSRGQDVKTQQQLNDALNQQLTAADRVQKNHRYYSAVLSQLADLLPNGVRVEALTIDDKNQVILNGFAARREQVIAFQRALEQSKTFANIESPLTNLVKETDVNFSFKFDFKTEALTIPQP